MTEQEIKVLDKMTEAHNEFMNLPVLHPSDQSEWVHHFHALQNIVMAREAVRTMPDYFYYNREKIK